MQTYHNKCNLNIIKNIDIIKKLVSEKSNDQLKQFTQTNNSHVQQFAQFNVILISSKTNPLEQVKNVIVS